MEKRLKVSIEAQAHTISFMVAAVSSYILNNRFTFQDSQTNDSLKPVRFFLVTLFSWAITTLLLQILVKNEFICNCIKIIGKFESSLSNRSSIIIKFWPTFAKGITIGVSMITNFLGYKLLVF